MPIQDVKITEANVRKTIDAINKKFEVKLSYKNLYKKANQILSKQGAKREEALTAAYIELSKEMCKKVLPKAIIAASNITFENEYMNTAAEKFSIVLPTRESKILIDTICDIISPGFKKNNIVNENQLSAIRDYELATLREHTYYNDMDACLEKWNSDCYEQDIADFDNIFKDNSVYVEKKKETTTIEAAKYYYKLKLTRERLAKHNFIWRLFNSDKIKMYKNYIEKTEQNLAKIGFNEAVHGENAISYLKDVLIDPFSIDLDVVKTTAKQMISDYRIKHTAPLNEARKKLEKAKSLNANPNTSIDKKIAPILEKYGIEKIDFTYTDEKWNSAAESYDKTRFFDGYRDIAMSAFHKSLQAFYNQKCDAEIEVSYTTMIKDARAVTVAVMEHYMPMLESTAFAELEKPIYVKLSASGIANSFYSFSRKKVPFTDEKFEAVKAEINELISKWSADPEKLLKEDLELACKYARQSAMSVRGTVNYDTSVLNDKLLINNTELSVIIEEAEEIEEIEEIEENADKEPLNVEIESVNDFNNSEVSEQVSQKNEQVEIVHKKI